MCPISDQSSTVYMPGGADARESLIALSLRAPYSFISPSLRPAEYRRLDTCILFQRHFLRFLSFRRFIVTKPATNDSIAQSNSVLTARTVIYLIALFCDSPRVSPSHCHRQQPGIGLYKRRCADDLRTHPLFALSSFEYTQSPKNLT